MNRSEEAMYLQYLLPHQLKQAVDEGWTLLGPMGGNGRCLSAETL